MTTWLQQAPTGDPGRIHTEGRIVRAALEDARDQVAGLFGVRPRQVVLTSGGTEAINAATWGATRADPGPVACAAVEHAAVRDASARSAPVVTLAVDGEGRIGPGALDEALDHSRREFGRAPALVQCQWANHEVGTLQPVHPIVERCRETGVLVHVDAVVIAGHLPVDLGSLQADLVSVSAHKLGGPAGMGALIVRRGLRIESLLVGGDQERARRAGLENLLGAVGFGAAAEALSGPGTLEAEAGAARARTERLAAMAVAVDGVRVLGDPVDRAPHIVCLDVDGVEAEPVLLGLDQAGIAAHSGSSCSSEALEPSPVLAAMGVDAEHSLRLSVGWSTTDDDIEAFGAAFAGVLGALRDLAS